MKSALFVDFDNVYSGLRKFDQANADQFGRKPLDWMNWITSSLALPDHVSEGAKRRILVRRCYLNPQVYQRFRSSFNLAGFEIVDCPALTGEGKTSTDIHMVLDMIELLEHETRYDEFIVFSADADFTPVLRKLRRWDRRTTVLAIGFPSAAYRASADLLIDQDEFIRDALKPREEDEPLEDHSSPLADTGKIVTEAVSFLKQKVAESPGPVPLAKLAALILSNVNGMDATTWAGLGNFRSLLEARDLSPLRVEWGEGGGIVFDPRRHPRPKTENAPSGAKRRSEAELQKAIDLILAEVGKSPVPVPCSRLASLITDRCGELAADWNGKSTFRRFIDSLELQQVRVEWNGSGGNAYEPGRQYATPPGRRGGVQDWGDDSALLPLATQVHEATGVPLLSPPRYRALFQLIGADVVDIAFDFVESSKRIRDRCRDAGHPISRADVSFVLRGLLIRGHVFGQGDDGVAVLSRKLADNVRSLCLREQILLDGGTDSAIDRWIVGQ